MKASSHDKKTAPRGGFPLAIIVRPILILFWLIFLRLFRFLFSIHSF